MKQFVIKKLEKDDILEILIEYFQEGELKNCSYATANLFGEVNEDLRFVGVFSKNVIKNIDLQEIDKNTDFNGDHSALRRLVNHQSGDGSQIVTK